MAVQSARKTYSVEEYQALQELSEYRDKIIELIDGELVEKMASFEPSRIASRINYYLTGFTLQTDLGYVTGADGGYIMPNGDVLIPDVAYISKERMPAEPQREAPVPPDLAVEVKSPTDSKRQMRKKAERYLENGARMVWLVFPDEQVFEVYVADEDVQVFGLDAVIEGGVVLPGFALPVRSVFV